jgi:hypothetical protein
LLDDTAILEFLHRDYPRFVNAEALVSGDPESAPDEVRRALRRAWEGDDRGELVEPLADRVLADVMGRAGRRRRSRRGARRADGPRLGPLTLLAPGEREVAAVCLYLRRSPEEAAPVLGMKDAEVSTLLDDARRVLAVSLEPRESPRDDAALEADLRRWLARADRPVPIPGVFERTLQERARRARRRHATTLVLSLAFVGAVAAGFLVASVPSPHEQARPTTGAAPPAPSLEPPPAPATLVPGVPFLTCHVTSLASHFEGAAGRQTAYVFQRARRHGLCTPGNVATAYLALVDAHRPVSVNLSGPIRCHPTCRVFSAPVFGTGPALLAVAVTSGQPADAIELYRVRDGRSGTALRRIAAIVAGRRIPVAFDWGGVGMYRQGADCAGSRRRRLDTWTAVRRHGVWMVRKQISTLRGSGLGPPTTRRSTARTSADLPSGGRDEFCGAPVIR